MSRLSATLHPVAASAVTLAAALAGLAVASDFPRLMAHGWRAAVAAAAVDVALAMLTALPAAPLLAAAIWGLRRARWPSLMALFILGAAAALFLTDAFYRPHTAPYVMVALAFGAVLAAMTAAVTLAPARIAHLVLLLGGGGALALERMLPLDREQQDLLALLTAAAVLGALRPLHRRVMKTRPALLGAALALGLGASLLTVRHVDGWVPGWRALSWQYGRWEPRLSRALRALIDFDDDGYSPIAWGGDCDDFDASRNPAAHDHDGIDANCNGTVKPLHPSDEDRGLLPAAGDPDAASVDLVVLVTIDCLRYDALGVMPRFRQLAQSGIALERLYAAGTDTGKSLPLLLRGSDGAPPIGERLQRHGIPSVAWFATHNPRLQPAVLPGFTEAHAPTDKELRWWAPELTDRALAALPPRGLVWLHYYDAHLPYAPGVGSEKERYLAALQSIDQQLGRLQEHLPWERTILIVTSDHGESFGDHGIPYHGLGAWEAVAHVPGLVAGGAIPPRHSGAVLSHRDIPATVMGAFGLPTVEEFGRSWLRLRQSAALHRFVVVRSASGPGGSYPMAALIDDRFKLIVTFENDLVELYRPPDETHDLFTELPQDAVRMKKQLALYRDIDGFP
jgi:hypothetical protein